MTRGQYLLLAIALIVAAICVIGALSMRSDCHASGGQWLKGMFSGYACYEVKGVLK